VALSQKCPIYSATRVAAPPLQLQQLLCNCGVLERNWFSTVEAMANRLYYGDNYEVLQRYIPAETVDLIYLDPPFNSRQDYNVLFAEKDGTKSSSQIHAFEDTWEWNLDAERSYQHIVETIGGRIADAMRAFRTFLGNTDMMAYLAMMAPRLVELKRVLKETGAIYLHCDPNASHYLKMLMDAVFGPQSFRNEITWKRTTAHSDGKQGRRAFGNVADILLFYSKSQECTFNHQFVPYDESHLKKYCYSDPDGRRYSLGDITGPGGAAKGNPTYEIFGVVRYWRFSKGRMEQLIRQGRIVQPRPGAVPRQKRYLDEMPGLPAQNVWDDIFPINSQAQERLGYPTQKPETLLERIIKTSSNAGDLVLDPFCGCGTTVQVAQRLERKWIGIDITHLAIGLIKKRLSDAFGAEIRESYEVIGEPTDYSGAAKLAEEDKYQFQWWSLGLVGARPVEQKKGADRGIDGRMYFHDERGGRTKQIVFSVKAGEHLTPAFVRDLGGVVQREKAQIGVLITLKPPTREMLKDASSYGFYASRWGKHPRIQIVTIEQLLTGRGVDRPPTQAVDVNLKKRPSSVLVHPPEQLKLHG
jgi:site-specific DNA-methyltransferase (adenine-specific)